MEMMSTAFKKIFSCFAGAFPSEVAHVRPGHARSPTPDQHRRIHSMNGRGRRVLGGNTSGPLYACGAWHCLVDISEQEPLTVQSCGSSHSGAWCRWLSLPSRSLARSPGSRCRGRATHSLGSLPRVPSPGTCDATPCSPLALAQPMKATVMAGPRTVAPVDARARQAPFG